MLRQIDKHNIETRLADESLYIFKNVNIEDSARYVARFEVYPISKFGTPDEIMKAMADDNCLLMQVNDNAMEIPKLALI